MIAKFFRILSLFAVIVGLASAASPPARAATDPSVTFIQTLGDKALAIIADKSLDQPQRKAQLSSLFVQGFDVPVIGRFVLGRYWRTATDQQKSDYLKVFSDYVVAIYADRFTGYAGVTFKVIGSIAADPMTSTVTSRIDRGANAPPVNVDWGVLKTPDGYKVVDVVVENLSMRVAQRDEFASVIENGGGNVQALIDLLKKKVNGA